MYLEYSESYIGLFRILARINVFRGLKGKSRLNSRIIPEKYRKLRIVNCDL